MKANELILGTSIYFFSIGALFLFETGFPRGIKSIEFWNRFSRPWKSNEFGQNVHKIVKKFGNSKFSHLFIQILFLTADGSSACFLHCVPSIKFLENEGK